MVITVYNISATSARVGWPSYASCLDTFYSVMYDPNWNSLLMGYKRKSFMHEERIPVSQTSVHLANLNPQTAYFLCVTCQAANPVRDQCQVFSTLGESSEGRDRAGWELAVAVWLTCCVLLLVVAGVLLWGCVHAICSVPAGDAGGRSAAAGAARRDSCRPRGLCGHRGSCCDGGSGGVKGTAGRVIAQERELRTLAKLCGGEPV